jgi:hypothetical protein
VSGEQEADAGDAAVFAAHHGEPFQREARTGRVSQPVLKTLKIARHVAVDECDPDACVHRKPTILPAEHVDSRIGVEEPLHAEPPHATTPHLLGERGQIRLGDRPSRQKRRRPVAVTVQARRSTKQPLDLLDEDPREGCDRAASVSEKAALPLRDGDHPLPHGYRGYHAIDEMRSCLRNAAAVAGGADAASLAREGHYKTLAARSTAYPAESEAEDAAGEVRPQLQFEVRRNGLLSDRPILEPAFELLNRCLKPGDISVSRPVAHAPAVATGSNCSHAPRGLRFAARDSSLHV